MSKNIVIQEGGVGRQFTADKLTTPLVAGGTCNWVPEDEVQLTTRYITENGTYTAASDGSYGFSQVTVNVTSTEKIIAGTTDDGQPVINTIDVIDDTISEIILGDYFIVTYDDDGSIARIEDNNGNACTLVYDGDRITGFDDVEDNRYTITFDSEGNIYQVFDPNAQECTLRDRNGDGKVDLISIGSVFRVDTDELGGITIFDDEGNDVTDDFDGMTITGVDMEDDPWRADIESDTASGMGSTVTSLTPSTHPGASIAGIDSDGDESVVTVGDDGSLAMEKLPALIKIENDPTKTSYVDGETIDISGIVVKAYLLNGDLWTTKKYPDGVIPLSELVLPVSTADITEVEGTHYKSADGNINAIELMDNIVYDQFNKSGFWRTEQIGTNKYDIGYDDACFMGTDQDLHGGGVFLVTIYNNSIYALGRFKTMRVRQLYRASYMGGFYYYGNFNSPAISPNGFIGLDSGYLDFSKPTIIPESSIDPTGLTLDSLINAGGGQKIPIQWARTWDGVVLEESFYINVGLSGYGGDDENENATPLGPTPSL